MAPTGMTPVDIDPTLAVLEIHRHRHVHVHLPPRRRRGEFRRQDQAAQILADTTIDVVTEWARKKFPNIDPPLSPNTCSESAGARRSRARTNISASS